MFDLAIHNGIIYLEGKWIKESIYIKEGIIKEISKNLMEAKMVCDVKGKKVIPGLIDSHVHLAMNGGKYCSADDFYTGSLAAAYGGITTIIDFLDEVSTAEEIKKNFINRRKLAEKSIIDYSFHTSVCNIKSSVKEIADMAIKLGIPTIKLFTTYKEQGMFSDSKRVKELLRRSSERDVMIMAHSENDDLIKKGVKEVKYHNYSRNELSEITKIMELATMTEYLDGLCYIVHTTCGTTVKYLKEKFDKILNKSFFVESCPHYFIFNDNKYKEENGYLYTMTPPLRSEYERNKLAEELENIHIIATDHCPYMTYEKENKTLDEIPMGVGGIEQSFSQMYTLFGDKIIDKFTINTAKTHGLYPKKGTLMPGADADIVVYQEINKGIKIEEHSNCDYSLYSESPVSISIDSVISRGKFVVSNRKIESNRGRFIERKL